MTERRQPDRLDAFGGLGELLRGNPSPAWLFDPHWLNILAVNPAATRHYGYSEAEFLRLGMADILSEGDIAAFLRCIEPGAPTADPDRRWMHRRRDGRLLTVHNRLERIECRGQAAFLAVTQPVDAPGYAAAETEAPGAFPAGGSASGPDGRAGTPANGLAGAGRTDADAAHIRDRTRNEFLGRLSHELRTPLNAVIGFAELLAVQDGALDPTQSRYLEHILDSGRHLLSLVDDVLDLQRIEERRLSSAPVPIDLGAFVAGETVLLEPLLQRQNLTLHNDVPAGLVVFADERCLRQALLNLATNAIKFNRPSGTVRWSAGVIRPGFAVLMVTDTGYGMSGEQIPRLFDAFDRLGHPGAAHDGSGLGLLIARGLVEHMGGTLVVESKLGVGTRAVVELPLAEPHSLFGDLEDAIVPAAPTRAALALDLEESPGSAQSNLMPTLRLLYVEDNRINAMLFEAVLGTRPDIELRIAETGWEALDVIEEWTPDVLVLDANLPDIHGVRLLRQMRELEALRHTPAFMCSADALEEDIRLAHEAGFSAYWTKPVDFKQVMADLRLVSRAPAAGQG
jgi:PAS domain S-box-containing protein